MDNWIATTRRKVSVDVFGRRIILVMVRSTKVSIKMANYVAMDDTSGQVETIT